MTEGSDVVDKWTGALASLMDHAMAPARALGNSRPIRVIRRGDRIVTELDEGDDELPP
jgi:hypothetical protein